MRRGRERGSYPKPFRKEKKPYLNFTENALITQISSSQAGKKNQFPFSIAVHQPNILSAFAVERAQQPFASRREQKSA
jgi:hypothetical protein